MAIPIYMQLRFTVQWLIEVDNGYMQFAGPARGFEKHGRSAMSAKTPVGIFGG